MVRHLIKCNLFYDFLLALPEPNDAYTWGENNNSTLGHPSPHKRTSPEAVDFFKKMGISLKQVIQILPVMTGSNFIILLYYSYSPLVNECWILPLLWGMPRV
jgi:hypothetical protein